MVEIIGRDTITDHDFDASFTIVNVIKQYHGIKQNDTIKVLEAGGIDCLSCLPYHWPTKRFIIKASIGKKSDFEANLVDYLGPKENKVTENVLLLSICDENTLSIEKDVVVGNITKRESLKKTYLNSGKKIVKTGYTHSHKKMGYYRVQQKMCLPKVEKIIKRRLN